MFGVAAIRLRTQLYAPPKTCRSNDWHSFFGGRQMYYYSYGRYALIEGLRASGIKPGDPVLMPAYICFEVEEELKRHGFNPIYYHVKPDLTLSSTPEELPTAKAILFVNYFGFATQPAPFFAYAAQHKALVIEDNSHGLLSRDGAGQLLGTRGDIGVFSIRKTFPLQNGAALVFNNSKARVDSIATLDEAKPTLGGRLRQVLKSIVRFITPWLGGDDALVRIYLKLKSKLGGEIPVQVSEAYHFSFAPNPAFKLGAKLASYDLAHETARRRAVYFKLDSLLREFGAVPVFPVCDRMTVPYAYAFRIKPGCEAKLHRFLSSYGLKASLWPVLPKSLTEVPDHYRNIWFVPLSWQ